MNKIKSSENIFPFYPLPCWKKLRGEHFFFNLQQGKKSESCAEYTPLSAFLNQQVNINQYSVKIDNYFKYLF